jgi:excisionase family DNA binding protein
VLYHVCLAARRSVGAAAWKEASRPAIETGREEPDPSAQRLAYSVNEAARLTGLSRDLLYDQMRRGNLPYVKIGRRRLITRQHLEQFLGVAS